MLLVIGDGNAKLGEQQIGEEGIVGKLGMTGERSDNGERFVSFCALNNLAIAPTMFTDKEIHRYNIATRSIMWPLDPILKDQYRMLGRIGVQTMLVTTTL